MRMSAHLGDVTLFTGLCCKLHSAEMPLSPLFFRISQFPVISVQKGGNFQFRKWVVFSDFSLEGGNFLSDFSSEVLFLTSIFEHSCVNFKL